jgi:hypothetical protein
LEQVAEGAGGVAAGGPSTAALAALRAGSRLLAVEEISERSRRILAACYIASVVDDADEELGGDRLGLFVVALAAVGEGEKGVAGGLGGGDESADLGELAGAAAVLEGV